MLDPLARTRSASRGSRGRRCGGRPRPASPWRGRRCSSAPPRRRAAAGRLEGQRRDSPGHGHASAATAAAADAADRRRAGRSRRCASWIGRSWRRKRSAIAAEALERVVVEVGDRLVGDVAAGHHQRTPGIGQQQVVERRVRQHDPEVGACRGATASRDRRTRPSCRKDDRPLGEPRRSCSSAGRARPAIAPARGRAPSERMACPRGACAPAARATAASSSRAAGEVEAAESLDRDDRAVEQERIAAAAIGSRAPRPASRRRREPDARPAVRAGVRLGVEAPVERDPRTRPGSGAHIRKPAMVVSGRS